MSSESLTFLFTDLEGSTRLWEEHPDAMRTALAHHDALVRDAVEGRGGNVVKSTGDGVLATFGTAQDGVGAAVAAQAALCATRWPEGVELRVRMGVHAGEATERDADWFGPDVNRAARVTAVAHGGQVLCTGVVGERVREQFAQNKPVYLALDGQEGLLSLDEKAWYGRMLIENVLAVEVPMISAVNGPCNIHAEVPLLGDIVLASQDAYFQDLAHFPRGLVPGDGAHVLWPLLVGRNRGRYLLLTGKKLTAKEACDWSAVSEVLPKDKVLDRAWELARELAMRPPLVLRYTRQLFTQALKRAFLDELGHGLARETYAQRQFFPMGGGMRALDRSWDQQPWSD